MSRRSSSAPARRTSENRLRFEALEERRVLALAVAEALLVDLDARDPSAGTGVWDNKGTLADFSEVGNPLLVTRGPNNNPAVSFNELGGSTDAYNGPVAPLSIGGTGTSRSIEVWTFNPTVDPEETLVSFGRRGGPDGSNMSFNYGSNGTFGAAGQWGGGPDIGWGPSGFPAAGEWHHLVITYDGDATTVYQDGVLKNRELHGALATHQGFPIRIAAQTNSAGAIDLAPGLVGHLSIANVRIHDGVLTGGQVINNYNEDAARFGKTPLNVNATASAPIHRYAFNDSGNPGLDSIGGADATLFNGASVDGGLLNLGNTSPIDSSNPNGQYALMPINSTIASLTNSTFEIWTQFRGGDVWQRAFDIGDNTTEYVFLSPRSGSGNQARFEVAGGGTRIAESFFASTQSEHHFVGVIDVTNNQLRLYIDGTLTATAALTGFSPASIGATVNNWLGRSQFGGDDYYNGTINEFRIYNTALTSDQVRTNTVLGPNAVPGVNDRPVAVSNGTAAPTTTQVQLQNATAFGTQAGFSHTALIDGVLPGANSGAAWAGDLTGGSFTPSNTVVFETVNNLNPMGNLQLYTFQITSGDFGNHTIGKLRLSATTDDRTLFADGGANGGDVSANWTTLTPVPGTLTSTNGSTTFTINADNSILVGGGIAERETYAIRVASNLANITGFRLEVIEDPALPAGGPGRAANGNFVVQEFAVFSQVAMNTNPTATFTQSGFHPIFIMDGVPNPPANSTQSWANFGGGGAGNTTNNVVVFETAGNVNPTGANTLLTFNITSGDFGTHEVGKIRISVTTDDRNDFADGAINGGDVTANWIEIVPLQALTNGPGTLTINPDNTILAGGGALERETWTIRGLTNLANITGVRLEVLEDPSLPTGGPGRASNGNFVVQEFAMNAQTNFFVVSEDGSSNLNVLANDFDPDGDPLTIVSTAGSAGAIVNNGISLTYTPTAASQTLNAGRIGFDSFNYTIRDPAGLTSTASAAVVIIGANDPPTAVNDVVLGAPVGLANPTDTFNQGAPFILANSINGIETENAGWAIFGQHTQNQTAVFQTTTPLAQGMIGVDMFFNSPNSAHKIQNFRLSVTTSPNPTVSSGAVWTELTPSTFVTSGPESDLVLQAANRLQAVGSVATPDSYFVAANNPLAGVTGIRLEVFAVGGFVGFNSGGGNGNIVLTEFRVRPAAVQSEDAVLNGAGLLLNDFDIDGPTSALSVSPTGPRLSTLGATVTVNANGTFTYDPTNAPGAQGLGQGQTGVDTFQYTITDGSLTSAPATVSITVVGANDAPTANANGPYTIAERQNLQLNANVFDADLNATLSITWDLDGDGQFDDATGANPLVSWNTLTTMTNPITDQVVNRPISLRVSDGIAPVVIVNTTLTVTNAAPTVTLVAPASAVTGQPIEFDISILDAPADMAAGFNLQIDRDGNGSFETTINPAAPNSVVPITFDNPGTFTVRIQATDKDGATSTLVTHTITVAQIVEDNGVLLIGGSGASDRILIQPSGLGGIQVRINNKIIGRFGSITEGMVFGGGGADTITIATNLNVPFTVDGGEGNDYVQGGALGDTLTGGTGADRLLGGGGNDTVLGGEGNDNLFGGLGNDYVDGEAGNDTAKGDAGDDIVLGGDGNDKIYGDAGNDLVRGGDGIDIVDGGAGNDALSGDAGADKLLGKAGNDVVVGGDAVDFLYGGTGEDLLLGGALADDSDDYLLLLLADWSTGSLATRVANLTPQMESDASEDSVGDTLYGEAGNDWFLLMLNDLVHASDRATTNVTTRLV